MFTKPENLKMYWKEFMHQCSEIGVGSLPIVIIISLFLGAVTTVQTAYQLVSPLVPQATIADRTRQCYTGVVADSSKHCACGCGWQ